MKEAFNKKLNALKLLQIELDKEKSLNAKLSETVSVQQLEIQRLKRLGAVDKILNEWHGRHFASAAAKLIMDPNPVELECSGAKTDTSGKYLVKVQNILAIGSDERLKKIFLKEPLQPTNGRPAQKILLVNKNGLNWDRLLFKIQKRGEHLLRISKSYAINIYDYTLGENNIMQLNKELLKLADESIHELKTDSAFDLKQYHNRIYELKILSDSQEGIRLNIQKIEEISRYIKSLDITNSK